ncbi:putative rap guanine nucleotide exchange factor 1 [Scophthalmus maximus]|uniref:CRK SH3-binding GNRP n=1 Tax=Scophthalmus maximus TaxID=52904 RepID=A0A2U9BU57_SCOMX|nr:putative rap guanine nucleotide exchange factor 1 [Scophthalmus maximus]
MSSRAESKTASQFVSLTLRLKDKLHQQRIKRTQRNKPADLKLQEQHESGCVLQDQQRDVLSSLQYFKVLVDRLAVDRPAALDPSVVGGLLGRASGGILEAVQTLVRLHPDLHNSETISACLTRLYLSVARLIRWADRIILHDDKESAVSVTTVIRAVLDGVKDLVRLAVESPVQSQRPVGQTGRVDDQETSDWTSPAEEEEGGGASPPPKPNKPLPQGLRPPVLPPKKRQSLPGPAPWRVAIVAPMRREPDTQEDENDCLKRSSSSAAVNTHCDTHTHTHTHTHCLPVSLLSDPDYDFLFTDVSSDNLHPLLPLPPPSSLPPSLPEKRRGMKNSQAPPSLGFDSTSREHNPAHGDDVIDCDEPKSHPLSPRSSPPPLPEKKRHIHQYLQVCSSYQAQAAAMFYQTPPTFSSRQRETDATDQLTHTHLDTHRQHDTDSAPSPEQPAAPALPPKKKLQVSHLISYIIYHIYFIYMIYVSRVRVDFFTSCDVIIALNRRGTTHTILTRIDLLFQVVLTVTSRGHHDIIMTSSCLFLGSSGSRQRRGPSEVQRQSVQQEAEQEEVLLTNQEEILNRVTWKTEEEEGPDVKAATPEILLVYATETESSTEQDLYCEAFLCTYRTFISPSDVISQLQHRYPSQTTSVLQPITDNLIRLFFNINTYRHLCDGCEAPELRAAAAHTLHLLVRVVDELCVMELDSDLLLLLTDLVFRLLIGGELEPAHLLRSNILSKMEQKWLTGSTLSLRPLAARGVAARPGSLLDFRSQDLAEQLTLMDSELFYKIELPEVLLWSQEQNEEKSPNLTEFTQHFNNVSFWVRSVIILQDKPQDREKLLLKFLKIMKHLRKLNNFNSYLSILSALDSAPLRRLDWQRNTAEALEEYSSLIDSSSSFRTYRAALAEAEPPCIPYLGLILQDLTFVHLGNPDTLKTSQGSKVNFSKRWQQFNILYTLRSYQQVPYSLQHNDDIILFFNGFSDHLAEEALWELSLRLRPRNISRTNQK